MDIGRKNGSATIISPVDDSIPVFVGSDSVFAHSYFTKVGENFVKPCSETKFAVNKNLSILLKLKIDEEIKECSLMDALDDNGSFIFGFSIKSADYGPEIEFSLKLDARDRPIKVSIPLKILNINLLHTIFVRYYGFKLDLFVDGVLVDEEWPMGSVGKSLSELKLNEKYLDTQKREDCSGYLDRMNLWSRKLSDDEIIVLSGGEEEVFRNHSRLLGDELPVTQYWKPLGYNTGAGDCMPFYHEGRFHLFFLFDRHHHKSKWGLGAHQWDHVSSEDLIHWEHHPLAIPITEEWEGSICTGSTIFHNGKYYSFYAARMNDGGPARLTTAVSSDGIDFEKTHVYTYLQYPYNQAPARDPFVFRDTATGMFHMFVTTELADSPLCNRGGCLAHLISRDMANWEQKAPIIVPGYTDQPECSDYFCWNGRYYLIFSNNGTARYRMSNEPFGPWERPTCDIIDGHMYTVPKTASFGNNRRIAVGFICDNGYAGNVVFRELIQNADGTLSTSFINEMEMKTRDKLISSVNGISGETSWDNHTLSISSIQGFGAAVMKDIPEDFSIKINIEALENTSYFGLCLKGKDNYSDGYEIRFDTYRRKLSLRRADSNTIDENERTSLYSVDFSRGKYTLEVIVKGDIIDICLDKKRTMVSRVTRLEGSELYFFAQNGDVCFSEIEIRPLL